MRLLSKLYAVIEPYESTPTSSTWMGQHYDQELCLPVLQQQYTEVLLDYLLMPTNAAARTQMNTMQQCQTLREDDGNDNRQWGMLR